MFFFYSISISIQNDNSICVIVSSESFLRKILNFLYIGPHHNRTQIKSEYQ